jgi:hypothetical protein
VVDNESQLQGKASLLFIPPFVSQKCHLKLTPLTLINKLLLLQHPEDSHSNKVPSLEALKQVFLDVVRPQEEDLVLLIYLPQVGSREPA